MKRLFTLSLLLFSGPIHGQTADFVDNTNSEGLSSMQRAILKEDMPRMEGLIKNGAGYYWEAESRYEQTPLINYAISNNKPKSVDFLIAKQTVVDYSSVETAMKQSNYALVKKLIDQKHLRAFERTNLIIENRSPTGRYSNVMEILPYEVYHTNRQFIYTLTNRRGEAQSYTLDAGTDSFENLEDYILQYARAKKQKGGLADFSGNISGIVTNILSKTNVRQEEIINIWTQTDYTNVLLPLELDSTELSGLAQIAVKQNNLPMLQYLIDKGADPNADKLLHFTVLNANKEMLIYLLGKGAEPFNSISMSEDTYGRYGFYDSSFGGTPFNMVSYLVKYLSIERLKIMEDYARESKNHLTDMKQYSDSTKNDFKQRAVDAEKQLATAKKNLPQLREIYEILKKYEE